MTSLKREMASGVFWIAVAKYSGLVISLFITAILARNVSPSAFGTITIVSVILAFLDIFINMGIGPAIVQFKNLTQRQLNSLFMLGAAIGVLLALLMFFSAPVIATYYNDPELTKIVKVLCVCLIFNALNIVPSNLMLKEKRFRTIALRTLFFQIFCGVLAVAAALKGFGIYALLITPILSVIGVFAVNFYNYPQKFTFDIDREAIKIVSKFSAFQFLFTFSNFFSRNLDKLIIGKYFSMADLGYYDKSYRLMQLPLQNISFVISPVLHPILSSLQNDKDQLSEKNKHLTVLLSNFSFPLGILLFFCAPEIIKIIYGSKWDAAIPIFKILALSLPLQMILSTTGSIFQAAGQTDHLFYAGIINTCCTVAGFFIAALCFRTIDSMAWAWDITLLINFCNSYFIMNKFTFKKSFTRYLTALFPQIANTGIVAAVVFAVFKFIPVENLFLSLIIKSFIIGLGTLSMAFVLHQYNMIEILLDLKRKFWKSGRNG